MWIMWDWRKYFTNILYTHTTIEKVPVFPKMINHKCDHTLAMLFARCSACNYKTNWRRKYTPDSDYTILLSATLFSFFLSPFVFSAIYQTVCFVGGGAIYSQSTTLFLTQVFYCIIIRFKFIWTFIIVTWKLDECYYYGTVAIAPFADIDLVAAVGFSCFQILLLQRKLCQSVCVLLVKHVRRCDKLLFCLFRAFLISNWAVERLIRSCFSNRNRFVFAMFYAEFVGLLVFNLKLTR